jgi:hypothetical protein
LNIITVLCGSAGLIAVIHIVFILAELSQRLGAVTKMPKYYRGFYLGAVLLFVALLTRLLRINSYYTSPPTVAFLNDDLFYLIVYSLPLALGATIILLITLRYWGWLFKEK